ncbi:MAG: TSUP family transporter [Lachnospiraceae bacterium]|nr:TSUP family transporter [Lachnospiraceae bacterium]
MEYFWYIIAAIGAGVGTGLAGLSAATVMVPILIVLCPSFGGEYGAYQATAIALASDILGSAVTSSVYAKNKHIDLKHGWVMMACIVALSTVGSYAAYVVGNVVLGGFTLFLTFFIGIRFLVKPDTSKSGADSANVRLGAKEIAISLFFGLTIGFGTGFVGTGGGMMMLVVFTAFLGYDLKTAVGTSTFIMTFTALIGFISHSLIHPAIILERWNVLIICIVTATAASLISAQFANRVNNKTVGRVTGVILVILGAAMIYLNYFSDTIGLSAAALSALVPELLHTLGVLILFLVIAVCIALLAFRFLHVDGEARRKVLHTIAFLLIVVLMLASEHWYVPAFLSLLFAVVVYPILRLLEKQPFYTSLFQERSSGEVRKSLLLLFGMAAVLITVFWGLLNSQITVLSAILAWGLGDEAAALIGKRFGRHKLTFGLADHKKSREGSTAMLCTAFLAIFITLTVNNILLIPALAAAILGAIVGAFAEAVTKNGYDTVSVPCAAALVIWVVLAV